MKYITTFLTLIVLALIAGSTFFGAKTIHDLLGENKQLMKAIGNLTVEDQIGYAKVINQTIAPDGTLHTTLKFVATARNDKTNTVLEREYTIEGDVIHFDALIVKFPSRLVQDGKERSLYLWRRVYGEYMSPSNAFPIEEMGAEPARYRDVFNRLSLKDRTTFWDSIWDLSNDPNALSEHDVSAIYGNVVYKKLKPGLIYVFKINNSGQLYPEVVPDM